MQGYGRKSGPIVMGQRGDVHEAEATRIAARVATRPLAAGVGSRLRLDGRGGDVAPPSVREALQATGQPLDGLARADMERRFGHDFSRVRVHVDGPADRANRDIGARAATFGNDVLFRHGEYDPRSSRGQATLAHELTHTLQQSGDPDAFRVQMDPDVPKETWKPKTGTTSTKLKGTYGDFTVVHGLKAVPDSTKTGADAYGKYSLNIEMTPNKSVGASEVGFVQAFRVGKSDTEWSTKKGDPYLSESEGARVTKSGWTVDRYNAKTDKTPFFGMYKNDKNELKQYSTARVGKVGGPTAMMDDTPGVTDPYKIQFSATAMDMKTGTAYGSVAWGFEYNSTKKISSEETPALLDAAADRLTGRDEAFAKWNKDVAGGTDKIEKFPGVK